VKALLDTHAFLWWIGDDPALSAPAREVIADAGNDIYLSAVSVWEISIKARAGKLKVFSGNLEHFIEQQVRKNSFLSLPITLIHSARIYALSNQHRDPFDQMLVAQSQAEGLPVISADKMIHRYDIDIIW
jgi:PIN domain nuclease of toxin-antitoxin system